MQASLQRAKKPVKPSASQVLRAVRATPPLTRRFTKQHRVIPLARARDGSISAEMSQVIGPMPMLNDTCFFIFFTTIRLKALGRVNQ